MVAGQPNRDDSPTGATFNLTDTKLYVAVVTVSAEYDNKLLEQLKTGYKEQSNGISITKSIMYQKLK